VTTYRNKWGIYVPGIKAGSASAEVYQRLARRRAESTAASLLLAAGVNVKAVSERLGHASAQMTLDVYSHVTPGIQEDAAERLSRAIGGRM